MFGALAGLLVGVILLENRKVPLNYQKKPEVSEQRTLQVDQWEKMAKPIAFGTFYTLMVGLVLWHVIGTYTGWFLGSAPTNCTEWVQKGQQPH